MKGFLAICVVALTVSAAIAVDEAAKKKVVDTFKKCKEANPITDAELEMLKTSSGVPDSPQAKCLAKCMLSEGKVLKDGKYHKEVAIAFADTIHSDDPDAAAKRKQIIEHCAANVGSPAGADDCEYAYKLAVCGFNKAKELGVKKPEW